MITPAHDMNAQQLIDLVLHYFDSVDREDLAAIKRILCPDCIFSIETHAVKLNGHSEIEGMFEQLWANHAAVKHQDFTHVPSPECGRIASQFQVINTHHDGRLTHKSNCNFFDVEGGCFNRIAVYMAGDNTLNRKT